MRTCCQWFSTTTSHFALYRQFETKGKYSQDRFEVMLNAIQNWNLFLAFNIIDGCMSGKSREPFHWLFHQMQGRVHSDFTETDIIS
jgi:hypothetical protein